MKEKRNILHTMKSRKAYWIGHILRKNCLLKYVVKGKIEGRVEVMGRQGRRSKQLLDAFREKIGYGKLEEEALDGTCVELVLEEAVDRKTYKKMNNGGFSQKRKHFANYKLIQM